MALLDTLFLDCPGYLDLRAIRKGEHARQGFYLPTDHGGIKAWIASNKGFNLYFGVATRDGKAGTKENIIAIPALFVDLDFKRLPGEEAGAIKVLESFPFYPTIIVHSGGGYHCYWKLREPEGKESIDRIEAIHRGITARLGSDTGSVDASHILRIPNTKNYNYLPPRPVFLKHSNGSEYSLDDFEDFVAEDPGPKRNQANYSEINSERLDKIMSCRFMQHWMNNAATLPEPDWYCGLTQLIRDPGGVALIHKYSKRYPKYSRKETDAKVIHAINSTGPMTCEKIFKDTGFVCEDPDCRAKAPAGRGLIENDDSPYDDCPPFSEETTGDNGRQREEVVRKGDSRGTVGGQSGDSKGDNEGDSLKAESTQGLAAYVETYLKNFVGTFSTRDMVEYIQSSVGVERLSRPHQKQLAKILARHVHANRLERTVRGGYRIINTALEDLDEGLGESEHRIMLPLLLNNLVYVEPKEVILVCGNSDAGKTCFAFQVGLLNKTHTYNTGEQGEGGFGVYHFVSEMGGVSFRNKLNSVSPEEYKDYRARVRVVRFKAESIADQIQPNSINIIDYLEPPKGDFREIVPTINGIFDKLVTGVAVVCIQMRALYPVGGEGVFWRPRLAVGLLNDVERNCKKAKIFKGKNNRTGHSIDGYELDYWVERKGTEFRLLPDDGPAWESPYKRKKVPYTKQGGF